MTSLFKKSIQSNAGMLALFMLSIFTLFRLVQSQEYDLDLNTELSFSCEGRAYGYYADVEADCRVFHICLGQGDIKWTFLCPNQTKFNQEYFVCDFSLNVDCQSAELFYSLNDQFSEEQLSQL